MNLRRSLYVTCMGVLMLAHAALAGEPDPIYKEARELATSGKRAQALAMLHQELEVHPANNDIRLLYGIILSWEHRFDEARRALDGVIETSPKYDDARAALNRVELWSDRPRRAEALSLEGLKLEPFNLDFLMGRVKALSDLKRNSEGLKVVELLLALDPDNVEAKRIQARMQEEQRKWEVETGTSYTWFNNGAPGWRESEVAFKARTAIGPVVARFDQMSRAGINSQLVELEAYPRVRQGTYLFLNGAFSADRQLYPMYRFAGELYQNLPWAMEGSAGFRVFDFQSPFFLYTGSLGRYFGAYLLSARTFVSHDSTGVSSSILFSARRYFGDHERFVSIQYGHGPSPFEVRTLNEIGVLKSNSFVGEVSAKVVGKLLYSVTAGFAVQDRFGQVSLRQYLFDGTFSYRF